MIEIHLNHAPRQVEDGCTLASLVESLGLAPAALATAVNGQFVPRDQRPGFPLKPGDAVTTFQPITGG